MLKHRADPRCLLWLALCVLLPRLGVAQAPVDSDRDGLSDDKEQALLEKFRPTFMISATDCAVRPARFQSGRVAPEPLAADGTIYGQVFPIAGSDRAEIHYYMLWDRDCGRAGHPLDVEHVSALITDAAGAEPRAIYWYAGAHEQTACDISSGARAEVVEAEHHGPRVWSSQGKHALYLREAMCSHGCGADSCDDDVELAQNGPVINLGELNAPANGALWVGSSQWMLSGKMDSDFSADVVARIVAGKTVTTLRGNSAVRGTIEGGDAALGGAATGAHHTGAALGTADSHTSRSLGKATAATERFLGHAWKAVFGRKAAPNGP